MRYTKKGRYFVYIGHLVPGCCPSKPNEQPEVIEASSFLWPTTPGFGQRFCRAYNARQLANGIPGRRWAFVAMRPKPRFRPCAAEDTAVVELLETLPLLNSDCREAADGEA